MIFFLIIASVVLLDQLTKAWVMHSFALYESKEVIAGLFNLTYLRNTGAAFSMFAGQAGMGRRIFFIGIALAALLVIVILYYHAARKFRLYTIGLGLIAGGALGNLIDRVRFGSVVDFLDFYITTHHWPSFNVADSAITVGVGLVLLHTLFFDGESVVK